MMRSLETIERTLGRFQRQDLKVLEHEPVRELVSPVDLVRLDDRGRKVVACPAGQSPPSWLTLTDAERTGLVVAPPPKPNGHMNPGPYGFTPENVSVGGYVVDGTEGDEA